MRTPFSIQFVLLLYSPFQWHSGARQFSPSPVETYTRSSGVARAAKMSAVLACFFMNQNIPGSSRICSQDQTNLILLGLELQ